MFLKKDNTSEYSPDLEHTTLQPGLPASSEDDSSIFNLPNAAPYRQVILTPSFLPRGKAPELQRCKIVHRNLILPSAPKPNGHSRDFLHAILSYDTDVVDFLHHENPQLGPGSNQQPCDKPTMPPNWLKQYAHV
ncbi:hypothetical protein TNCV_829601 [Trichonephila clavipes]|nr:hypothetical protein TNCV_829601 [Trichonephila clavipes]